MCSASRTVRGDDLVQAMGTTGISKTALWISVFRNPFSDLNNSLTTQTSVKIFSRSSPVQAHLRAVIFAITELTMTASAAQIMQNLPHCTFRLHDHRKRDRLYANSIVTGMSSHVRSDQRARA